MGLSRFGLSLLLVAASFASVRGQLSANCGLTSDPAQPGILELDCTTNFEIGSSTCTLDGQPLDCDPLPTDINTSSLSVGTHTVTVTLTDQASGTALPALSISFAVTPGQQLSANCGLTPDPAQPGILELDCTANFVIGSSTCTLDGQPFDCDPLPTDIDTSSLSVGTHTVTVTLTDQASGTTLPAVNVPFTTMGQQLSANCGLTQPAQAIRRLNCTANFEIGSSTCTLDGQPFDCDPLPTDIDTSSLSVGTHTVTVTLTDQASGTALPALSIPFTVTPEPTVVTCSTERTGAQGDRLILNCSSTPVPIVSATCSLDNSPFQTCSPFPVTIDISQLSVGTHILQVRNTLEDGRTIIEVLTFEVVSEFAVVCTSDQNATHVIVTCIANKGLADEECSLNGAARTQCTPLEIAFAELQPGVNTYVIILTSVDNQIFQTTGTIEVGTTPPFSGSCQASITSTQLTVTCTANQEIASSQCSIDGGAATDCDLPFILQFEGSGLLPGEHTLVVTLTSSSGARTQSQITFTVPAPPGVRCYTQLLCAGPATMVSSIEECCLTGDGGNTLSDGLSFEEGGACGVCVVFGWRAGFSFQGSEQGESYSLLVGYLKGADSAPGNGRLRFNVEDTEGTATEGASNDYRLSNTQNLDVRPTRDASVAVTFRVDNVALEPDETLTLTLDPQNTLAMAGDSNVFLLETIQLTIQDSDVVTFQFTESDYRTREEDGTVPVIVERTLRIATDVTLRITPVNFTVVNVTGFIFPDDFPDVPEFDPIRPIIARSYPEDSRDFSITPVEVTFPRDEINNSADIDSPIVVFDDLVNEADEVFVVLLEVVSDVPLAQVNLVPRNTSLCRIVDNDPIRIGFEFPRHNFVEQFITFGSENSPVFLIKENNRTSEQTFEVVVTAGPPQDPSVDDATPIEAATPDNPADYQFPSPQIFIFEPDRDRIPVPFRLFDDLVPESTEGFLLGSAPSEFSPPFLSGANPSSTIAILDNDPEPPTPTPSPSPTPTPLCPDPPALVNGVVTFTGNSIGDTATYTCNTGFELIGSATATCGLVSGNAVFSPAPPECRPLCPDPPAFVNGMLTFTGNSIGDTATYTCNSGFELIGSSTATCVLVSTNAAVFSPAPPECRPICRGYYFINCDDINDPSTCEYVAHWIVRGDNIDFNVTAETAGWVAIGFSPDRFMPNTDVVLGAADGQGSFVTDRFADIRAEPPIDASQDISNAMASHVNGFTSISFTRPRNSGDPRDFSLDQCRYFLFAWSGPVDTITMVAGYHGGTNRMPSTEEICLPSATQCPAAPTTPTPSPAPTPTAPPPGVRCYTQLLCAGPARMVSSIEECCLTGDGGNTLSDGLSFEQGGACGVCVVFGWRAGFSFQASEQGEAYSLVVGYLKGADSAPGNGRLQFNVDDTPGTATEGASNDYRVSNTQNLDVRPTRNATVQVTFRVDSVALEQDETLALTLDPQNTLAMALDSNVFLLETIQLTIQDSDVVTFQFTESDYRTREDGTVPVIVERNLRIATDVTLRITPVNFTVVNVTDFTFPDDFPDVPEFDPIRPIIARSYPEDSRDFSITPIEVTFPRDEINNSADIDSPIAVFDDVVNEADEVFVVLLDVVSDVPLAQVNLVPRNASLCRIVDNDPIRIGFEFPRYNFVEQFITFGSENSPVFLIKENNRTSEQAFEVVVTAGPPQDPSVEDATPIEAATPDNPADYQFPSPQVFLFEPDEDRIPVPFVLFDDLVPESTEGFLLGSAPSEFSPPFLSGANPLTTIAILDNDPEPPTPTPSPSPTPAPLCPDPPLLVNGMVTFTGNSIGDTATYTCNSGFELIGSATATCGLVSTNIAVFSPAPPECRPLCPDPPALVNGMVTFTGNSIGDTATYTCNSGFELIGSATATCGLVSTNAAEFSPAPPVCRPLCPDPPALVNGMVTFTGNSIGDTATYTCNSGFELIGSATATCGLVSTNAAEFSPAPPECRPLCPDPPLLPIGGAGNSDCTINGNSVGDTADCTCPSGFELVGTATLTCTLVDENTAMFSPARPVCILEPTTPTPSPTPTPTPPVIVECPTSTSGDIVTVSCITGPGVMVARTTCSFDGGPPEDCDLPVSINVLTFTRGAHTLTIRITDVMGRSEESTITFNGNAPLLSVNCMVSMVLGRNPEVDCFATNNISQVTCSYDGGPQEICSQSFEIDLGRFTPGTHTLVITFTDIFGYVVPASPITFIVAEPLIFMCSQNQTSEFLVTIDCISSNDLFTIQCGIDGIFQFCTLPFSVDLTVLSVGDHLITIAVVDVFDQSAQNTTIVNVPEPDVVDCTGSLDGNTAQIDCPDIGTDPDFTDFRCLIDGTLDVPCTFPFVFDASSFPTGDHTVRVIARSMSTGEMVPLGETQFTIPPLDFTFINNTPILRGDTVTAEFEANRPGLDIMCHLTHLDVPRRNCSSGTFSQTNLPPGDYTVRIVARDIPRGERFIIRSRIWVHSDDTFCAVYLTNRQMTVNGNNATVEFGSSGVASEFICVLDRMDIFPCQSPVQLTGLQPGRRHFKVIPTDCGREFRPRVVKIPIN